MTVSLERAIQLLAASEEVKSGPRTRDEISKKIGAGKTARGNENRDEKVVREEKKRRKIDPKVKLPKPSKFEGRVLDWLRSWN